MYEENEDICTQYDSYTGIGLERRQLQCTFIFRMPFFN